MLTTPEGGGNRTLLSYDPGLDGVRAVAVLAVLLFHGGVAWTRGGFLGVDVFFVLSGYLITTLLLRERVADGDVDLRRFWLRRLRRLVPALLLLLAVVGVLAPFVVEPAERASLRGDGLAALVYVANWRFVLTEQSYFAGAPSLLRHLWSLSVEEQWYLILPVALAAGLRRRPPVAVVLGVVVALAVASTAWMAHLASGSGDLSRAYYGTDSRAHTLLVGTGLALAAAQWPLHRARRVLLVLGLVGGAFVAAAFALVDEGDRWMYRGGFLGLALATAALIAAVTLPRSPSPIGRVLAWAPLVAVGRISYGLYLWHWPVDIVLSPERTGLDGGGIGPEAALFALRTLVTFALAIGSYRLVEQPVRAGGVAGLRLRFPGPLRSRPATAGVFGVLAVWLLVAGTVGTGGDAPSSSSGLSRTLATAPRGVPDDVGPPPTTLSDAMVRAASTDGIAAVPTDRPVRVLVAGDSVGWTLSYAQPVVPPTLEVESAALIGCGLVDGYALPGGHLDTSGQDCDGWPVYWQARTVATDPDVALLLFGAWEVYDHLVGETTVRSGTPEMADLIRAGLDVGVDALVSVDPDVRIAVVGMACMRERDPRLGGTASERNDPARVAWVNDVFSDYVADLGPRAIYLDLGDLLCPGGRFRERIDGVVVRPDGSHFADGTSGPVWAWLADGLQRFARVPVPGR